LRKIKGKGKVWSIEGVGVLTGFNRSTDGKGRVYDEYIEGK